MYRRQKSDWAGVGTAKHKPAQAVEEVKVAFCLAGASRSLPTVPVLRGIKKNVLQSRSYSSWAFAALSLSPAVPGVHDYNMTLANKLANVQYVQRAMLHLAPALKSWTVFNQSEVLGHYGRRSCLQGGGLEPSARTPVATQWLTTLYAMQRSYSLVRSYELGRTDGFQFDYVVRLRPDQLITQPFASALNVSVDAWPDEGVLKPRGVDGVAVMAQGPAAAAYFRSFAAATSCSVLSPQSTSPPLFPESLQCWRPEVQSRLGLGPCVISANLMLHGVRKVTHAANPGPLAWMCNYDAASGGPTTPTPLPANATCVTYKEVLKRPRPYEMVEDEPFIRSTASSPLDQFLAAVLLTAAIVGFLNRKQLYVDCEAVRVGAAEALAAKLEEHQAERVVEELLVSGEEAVRQAWASPRVQRARTTLGEYASAVDSGLNSVYGSVPGSDADAAEGDEGDEEEEEGEIASPPAAAAPTAA